MKLSVIRRLLVASWRLLIVYEGPAILFVLVAFYGFATERIWLGVTTTILALLSTALCWYLVGEVKKMEQKKEKELAEKNQQEQPKITKQDSSTEKKQKG